MAKNTWRSVTEPMTDNSEKNTWNSAKTPISSAKNVTENNYAIENWYRAEQSGDPNAGDALLGASLSQKDFDNWEQWRKQNAGKLDVEYTFKSLDQDVLSRVADKYKSQWGDKQYYDLFDPEDSYRLQTGAMPKYLIDKYDMNDPYDKYLYENNLPYRSMFNDMYSEAYKDYTAEKEEEAAYQQQYMNFQFDLYSQMLKWQQNEETAAVNEGRDPQDVDPESFIANLLVDPKYADVAKHFQLPGEDEEEPDSGTYDFLNDYLKENKKEPDERAFTVDDLMNPYYEMLDQARAEQEAKWWASLTDAEQRQVSIYRSEQNLESLDSEIDALNKDIARAQNRGEDASALISQRDEKKSQKKKLETDIAAARKEDRSKSYEEYDQALLSMDINSDTREAEMQEQLDALQAKRDEAWEAENKARVGGRWEEYMQLAATRDGLDKEIAALSAQLNGATLEKSMATAMQTLEKYKSMQGNADFAEKSIAPVKGDGRQDVYSKWDAQTRTDYLVLNDHADGILSTDGNANKYRWISQYATDDEIATLNYIANTQGEAATKEYMDALGDVLKIRNMRDESDGVEDFTSTTGGAIVGSIATVPMSIASAVEGAGNMLGAANGDGAIDMLYNASATRFRTGVRSNVSEQILANNSESFIPGVSAGQIWNFLYQTSMSMADTGLRLAIMRQAGMAGSGVEAASSTLARAGLAVAGLDAASSTLIDQLESGATTNQALSLAAISGVAETLTEKIGLDNLFKPDKWMAGTFKQYILNTLKQGGAEASEEILSEIINIIGEEMIRSDESELRQQIAELMKEKGISQGAAYGQVIGLRILESGAGGFMSGLFFGAFGQSATIANTPGGMKTLEAYNEAKRQGKALSTDLNIAFTRDIMTLGLSDEATTQALSVKDAYANQPASLITPEGHALLQNMVNVVNYAARTQNTQNKQRLARQVQARSRLNSLYQQATELRNEAAAALERGDIATQTKLIQKCNALIQRYTAAYEAESATLEAENAKAEEQRAKTESKVLDAVEKAANQIPVEVENQRTKLGETVAVQAAAQQDAEIISGMAGQTGTQYQAGVIRKDSGKKLSRNARQQLRVLDGLGKKYNTPIVVEDTITRTGKDGRVYSGIDNAYYDPKDGSIHVALDAEEGAYMFFAVHELVHKIETESSEMYTILHDFVIDKLNANDLYAQLSKGEGNTFDERVASVMELYAKNGVELTKDQAESEIIADAIPVILTDKQTVQELVRTDRTLAERIRDFFEEFFDELTQMVAQLAFGDANKAEVAVLMDDQETVREIADLFTAALESTNKSGLFSETAENGEYSAKYDGNQAESWESGEGNGDIRHSIAQIVADDGTDYGIGVMLDSNMLTGLTKDERMEMVKLRVINELAGKTVIAYDGENNPVEISFAQKNEKFRNSSGKKKRVLDEITRKHIYKEIKQESVIVADELIAASKRVSSNPSYHSHDWLDGWGKNNWDTRTVYVQEKNKTVWEATLHIANSADGRKILYDIDPIKMVAGSVKSVPTTTNINITDVDTKSNTSAENSEENFYDDLVNGGDQPRFSMKTATLEDRVSGDALLNAEDLIDTVQSLGGEVDANGYITVYHRTSPQTADQIRRTGKMTAKEDGLFFSTASDGYADGYGGAIVELKIPAEKLELDDVFDNEAHLRLPLGRSRVFDVSEYVQRDSDSGDHPRLSMKSSGRDSEGNTLSEGQAEYFKDSKMRDDDGNLLVVYHGSPAYDEITTFKRGKKGWLGSGIYVTSRKSDAQRYANKMGPGGRVYSLYANVTNPLVVTEQNPVPVILKAAYGRDSVYRNRSAKQANDPDIITRSDIQKLAGAGYDGIIWKYGGSVEASLFDPEQVKRTDNTKPTSNPDTRFSMKSTARDSAYQQAVESSDMDTAQELVNEAAAEAGYTIKAYHGTQADRFNVFDKERVGKGTDQFGAGFYFATDQEAASHYGSTMYSVFLDIKNPIRIQRSMDGGDLYDVEITPTQAYKILKKHPLMYDAEESPLGDFFDSYWEEGPKDWMIREMAKQYTSIGLLDGDRTAFRDYPNELHEAIREVLGYDGVEVTFDNTDGKFYVAWFDTQMKSADPVTYDDNGNVIPLSERFNREENDIRYSMKSDGEINLFDSMIGNDQQTDERLAVSEKELARVKAENERLSDRIDALKEQFKVTKGYRPNEKALRRVAQGVLKRASSKYDVDTLTEDLRGLFDSIGNQDGFDSDSIMATANAIARKVLEKSSERDDTVYEATKDARDYFRRARLSLTDKQKAETASAYDSYNAYRRSLMGKLNLANDGMPLDQAWGEISEMFPGYFDKDTPEGDQPAKVKEFLETAYARPYRNPYGTLYDMDDAAYELASELFDEYFNVPQVQTFADKQRSKLNEANRKYRESIEAERRAYEEQYQDALALSRGMREIELKNLAKKYSEAMDDQKAEYRQKYREMVRKKNRQLDEQNAAFQAQKKRRAETRENAKYRDRIRKNAKELYTWLQTPNKKKHVPAALQNTVAKLLENIDIEGYRPSQKADAWRDAVRGLSDMYSKYALGKGELAESGVYFSVPDAMLDALDMLTSSAENGRKLGDLNTEELRSLDLVVAVTKSAVTNVNKLYANKRYGDVATVAERTINEVSGQKQRNYQYVGKLLNVDMLDSFSYAHMLGDGAESIIGALEKGAEKSYDKIRQGSNFVEKTLSDVGVKARDLNKWSKDKVSFKLESGKEVKLTQAQVMALYALNKRAQARQHILSGGIEIAERGRDQKQLDTFKVTEDDISNILGSLTDEQKRIMDALQGFLSNDAAAWGNEVWMELYQYEMFGEKNYWPIRSAASGTKTEDPDAVRAINAMLNIGATKSLNENANNPIVIEDAFDVFSKHIAQMARLNGLAAPLEDALKWYNYVARDENGARDYDRVTKKAIERVFGQSGNQYFLQLIKDINGLSQGGTGTEIPSKLLSNYKRAAVAGKLRVVVQQPTAIIRATALVNPKFFATKSAAQIRENIREMQEKNPLAWWKSQGNYEIGTGRSMRGMLFGSDNTLDAVTNLAMEPAGLADNLAWGVLWAAVKNEVKTYNKGLDTNSDAYWEKVTDRFNEVVNQTQVVDSVMHRSQIMRSKSDLAQMSTSFMSEPTKTYNMVRNCIMDVKLGRSGSKKKLVRALIALLMSIAANAAVKGLHDTLRDRDEDDEFGEVFAEKFVSGFLDDVNPLGYIPYVKDALSIVQGYDVERLDTAALSDAWTSIKHAYEAIVTGDSRYTDYKLVTDVAKSVSSLTGLPLPGLIDLVNMTANTISPGAIPKYHSLDKEQRQEAKAAGLDVGELERVMSGYERGTNADKALSLLAMSEKTGADYSEEEFDLIAEIVGLNYSSSKNGPLDKWAEKEQKRYLKGKQSELKDGEITQEEYDEIEDRFDEYWRIIVGG